MTENLFKKAWYRIRRSKPCDSMGCPPARPDDPVVKLKHFLEVLSSHKTESHSRYIKIIKQLKDTIPQLLINIQSLAPAIQQKINILENEIRQYRYNSVEYETTWKKIVRTRERKWAIDGIDSLANDLFEAINVILEFGRQFPSGTVMSPSDFDQLLRYRKRHNEDVVAKLTELLQETESVIARERQYENTGLNPAA
jgi:hypothetical protein